MYPDVNDKALIDGWTQIEKKPGEMFAINLTETDAIYHRNLDLYHFFTFLKLIPCHKAKFSNAVKSFMVFSEVF